MIRIITFGLILAVALVAAPPVATVSSAKNFQISGTAMKVAGVPNWPLVAGDQLVMGSAPGWVRFQDGTELYVLPKSKLDIVAEGGATRVAVREGGIAYRFAEGSSVELTALTNRAGVTQSREGRLWLADGESYWHLADTDYLRVVSPVEREVGDPIDFESRRITPVNFEQVPGWNGFNPGWGNKPGDPGPPHGGVPPGQIGNRGRPPWLSGRVP